MRTFASLFFVLFTAACGSSGSGGSGQTSGGAAGAGTGGSGGIGSTGGSGAAAGSGSSAGSGGSNVGGSGGGSGGNAGAPPCVPAAGTAEKTLGCDFVRVGIIEDTGKPARLDLSARVSGEGCILIDEIILGTEASPLQTIDAGGIEAVAYSQRLLSTEADPDIAALCDDEKKRIEPFGFVAKGRTDGGTFTAKCGAAGTGSSWPPGVAMSCHSGIAEAPMSGNSMVDTFSTFTNTTVWSAFRHPPGTSKITSVGPDARIIPFPAPWSATPPLNPFDSTGWTGSPGESTIDGQEMSQFQAYNPMDVLGMEICPPIDNNNPFPDPKPVYFARFSGQTSEGPFTSEILVDICTRTPPSGP